MANKRIEKKRERQELVNSIANKSYRLLTAGIEEESLKTLSSTQGKSLEQLKTNLFILEDIEEEITPQEALKVSDFRQRYEEGELTNQEKNFLIKRYYDLKKEGWIKDNSYIEYYNDVVSLMVEDLSSLDLIRVIEKAEANQKAHLKTGKFKPVKIEDITEWKIDENGNRTSVDGLVSMDNNGWMTFH